MEVAGVVGAERGLKRGLAFAMPAHRLGIACGQDRAAAAEIGAGVEYLLDRGAECGQVPAVDLHQAEIDAIALADIAFGQAHGFRQGRRMRLRPGQMVDIQGERVAAAFHPDDRLEGDRSHGRGTGQERGGDHRSTHSGRATPWTFRAGTGPKYRLSKLRGSWPDSSHTSPGATR